MLKFLRSKTTCVRRFNRNFTQIPFDLNDKDDKFKEFNNMYVDLFTPDMEPSLNESSPVVKIDEIDEINSEINDLYNIDVLKPSELASMVQSPGKFVIRSLSANPFFNLALEEYIFQTTPLSNTKNFQSERLILYVNDKCVVIGKNQNIWKELYLSHLKDQGYDILRRKSGGGAVVHDLGNVNYCYLTSRDKFQRDFFNKLLVKWLIPYNSSIGLNHRGDIILNGKKISGSAFKIAKGKSYHHGTMLINSDITLFSNLLKPEEVTGIKWNTNSIESVRSSVDTLQGKGIDTVDQFCDIVTSKFRDISNKNKEIPLYYCDETSATSEILETMEEFRSFEWRFLSGPKFKVTLGNIEIFVEKGIIVDSSLPYLKDQIFVQFVEALNQGNYSEIPYKL